MGGMDRAKFGTKGASRRQHGMVQPGPREFGSVGQCGVESRALGIGGGEGLSQTSKDRPQPRLDSLGGMTADRNQGRDGFIQVGIMIDDRFAGDDGIFEGDKQFVEAQEQIDQFDLDRRHCAVQ